MSVQSVSAAIFPPLPSQEELNLKDALAARLARHEALGLPDSIRRLLSPSNAAFSENDSRRKLIEISASLAGRIWTEEPTEALGEQDAEDRLEAYRCTLEDLVIGSRAQRPIRFPYKG